jgi:hypothetical protein
VASGPFTNESIIFGNFFCSVVSRGMNGGNMEKPTNRTLELDGNTVEIFESGASVVLQILCPSFECVPGQRIRIVGKENLLKLRDAINLVLEK